MPEKFKSKVTKIAEQDKSPKTKKDKQGSELIAFAQGRCNGNETTGKGSGPHGKDCLSVGKPLRHQTMMKVLHVGRERRAPAQNSPYDRKGAIHYGQGKGKERKDAVVRTLGANAGHKAQATGQVAQRKASAVAEKDGGRSAVVDQEAKQATDEQGR